MRYLLSSPPLDNILYHISSYATFAVIEKLLCYNNPNCHVLNNISNLSVSMYILTYNINLIIYKNEKYLSGRNFNYINYLSFYFYKKQL